MTLSLLLCVASFSICAHADDSKGAAGVAPAADPGDEIAPPGMVKVERQDVVPLPPPSHDFVLRPYQERRGNWGWEFSLAYSSYAPTAYQPAFLSLDYGSVYGSTASTPLMELEVMFKRNMSFGSLGVEVAGGTFGADSQTSLDDSKLSLTEWRVGLVYIADTLFSQPYFAPYVTAGAYMMLFNEGQATADVDFRGNTQPAPYVTFGAQFGLDWMDNRGSRESYENGSVQATFLFLEIRKYFASSNSVDPDFESGLAPGGGLRLEF